MAKASCESKAEEEGKGGVVAHNNVDLTVKMWRCRRGYNIPLKHMTSLH